MKKTFLLILILIALASALMFLINSKDTRAREISSSTTVQGTSSERSVRSSVSGIKVEQVEQITYNGQPFISATLRNVTVNPITYILIRHGNGFTELSFLTSEYLAPQATTIQEFDAQPAEEIVVAAAVYADGTTEGEALPVKKAAFYHDEFLAAAGRYLTTIAATRSERQADADVIARLLTQAAEEPRQKEHRTAGALAFSHFLTQTLKAENGRSQAEKLDHLIHHLQNVQSMTHATRGGRR